MTLKKKDDIKFSPAPVNVPRRELFIRIFKSVVALSILQNMIFCVCPRGTSNPAVILPRRPPVLTFYCNMVSKWNNASALILLAKWYPEIFEGGGLRKQKLDNLRTFNRYHDKSAYLRTTLSGISAVEKRRSSQSKAACLIDARCVRCTLFCFHAWLARQCVRSNPSVDFCVTSSRITIVQHFFF